MEGWGKVFVEREDVVDLMGVVLGRELELELDGMGIIVRVEEEEVMGLELGDLENEGLNVGGE